MISARLVFLTVSAAVAGACGGFILRSKSASSPSQTPEPASAAARPRGPLENTRVNLLERRLRGLAGAGTATARVAAALELANLQSVEEIKDLLLHTHRFPDGGVEELAKVVLYKRWLELDPAGALSFCRRHHAGYLPKIVADFSLTEPAAARTLVLALPSGSARTDAWKELCRITLEKDPDNLWSMLDAPPLRDTADYATALDSLVRDLVRLQPEAAVARLNSLTANTLRATRLALAEELTARNAPQGWAWAAAQPRSTDLLRTAMRGTMKASPAEAVALLSALPPDQQQQICVLRTVKWETKSAQSLADAVAASSGLSSRHKTMLATNMLIGCALSDPAGANALAALLPEETVERRVSSYVTKWSRSSFAGASTWVARLAPGAFRTAAEKALNAQRNPAAPVEK